MTKRCAVIGYGSIISKFHCEGILATEGLELAGVCDRDEQRLATAREAHGCHTWTELQDVLDDKTVDAIVAVLPNDLHSSIGCAALEAGKHVVVEKPMAITESQCQVLIETAERCGKLLTVHQNRRWDNDFLAVKHAISQGRLGKVDEIAMASEGLSVLRTEWRRHRASGGGNLYDWGAHRLDQMLQLALPAQPVWVFGDMVYDPEHVMDTELAGVVHVGMSDGVRLTFHFSNINHHTPRPLWFVSGREAALTMERQGGGAPLLLWHREGKEKTSEPLSTEMIEPEPRNWHHFYANFAEAMQGRASLAVKPEESMLVVRIIEAAIASAQQRRVISL